MPAPNGRVAHCVGEGWRSPPDGRGARTTSVRTRAACLVLAPIGLAGPADAEPVVLRVRPHEHPLVVPHTRRVAGNPDVATDNPMGVVGLDGPPDDVPSVGGDSGPMTPGSIVSAPVEGHGLGLH
ncbi:hypothetical protein R1A27_23250 [Methylobacterium sp. NMS12]|uniref:hypothetical protein n=1 Tax=Methylobacterium sp. NMS12 TaxID=3079766 RepID=UPI003F8841C5